MTIYGAVRFEGDDAKVIKLTAGFIGELPAEFFSPEQLERQRLDTEREERQIAAEALARAIDESPNMPGFAQPPVYSVSERLAAFSAAQDRADRREAARLGAIHGSECGCLEQCADRNLGTGSDRTPPKRLGSVIDKELAAAEAEFMNQPATVGDLAHLAGEVGVVKKKVLRLTRKG